MPRANGGNACWSALCWFVLLLNKRFKVLSVPPVSLAGVVPTRPNLAQIWAKFGLIEPNPLMPTKTGSSARARAAESRVKKSVGSLRSVGFVALAAFVFGLSPLAWYVPLVSTLDKRVSHRLLRQLLNWSPLRIFPHSQCHAPQDALPTDLEECLGRASKLGRYGELQSWSSTSYTLYVGAKVVDRKTAGTSHHNAVDLPNLPGSQQR